MKKVSRPASRSAPLAMPTSGTSVDAELGQGRARRVELALAAVDEDEVGPGREGRLGGLVRAARRLAVGRRRVARRFLHEAGEAAGQHLAHHAEIVAGRELLRLDVEGAVMLLHEALRARDDHARRRRWCP